MPPMLAPRLILVGVAVAAAALCGARAAADDLPDPTAPAAPPAPAATPAPPLAAARWAPAPIDLHDLPDTDGEWQEGVAVIRAPRADVHRWLTDYESWPRRFTDIAWAKVLGDDAQGRHRVQFRSRIAGATITVAEAVAPDLLAFTGEAWFAYTQGRIHLIDRGDGTTQVLMQSTANARGIAKLFATKAFKRKRAFAVTRSHLESLDELARRRTTRELAGAGDEE